MKKHVLIISHGSRDKRANADFKKLVSLYRLKHPTWVVDLAFLELAQPSIPQALKKIEKHTNRVEVLPLFLFQARHVREHIPAILQAFEKENLGFKALLKKPLGPEPKLLAILDERLK
jgi:sirohydrochlorin cobaltochelatase